MSEPASGLRLRRAARALLLVDDAVLLVRFVFPSGIQVWALPGGGVEDDESHEACLRRELHEELGLADISIGPHVWTRTHIIPMTTGHDGQVDDVYAVPTTRFDPHPTIGWDALRDEFVHEIRWWSLDELHAADGIRFAPRRLPTLVADIATHGLPTPPVILHD